jgi:hypothetical protein
MAENLQRSTGRPQEYRFDRGGIPAEMGPYIGIVVNNVDNTRQGRLQVWIEQFGATNTDGTPNLTDPTVWRTVRYCPPFYGATSQSGNAGAGTYPGNRNSYGMWFTPPDLGTRVLCFFVAGDPSVGGYYIGCIPEDGMNHMIPAIGASSNYQTNNSAQQQLLNGVVQAPVTEVNDIDPKFIDNPRFFDQKKPVQSVVEGILLQQGLNKDPIRGPIRSSSQRESPSNCYGISTPGKPIYQGGLNERTIKSQLEKGQVKLQDIAVIGRQGGHTFVMDDGDLEGKDTLIRIRTAKGHQITMSDDGDAFYITHANGQTWIELGKQGTVDVYSSNSINLRTQGVLNFHADKGINMYSGGGIKIKSKTNAIIESSENLILNGEKQALVFSKTQVGIRSDGNLALQGKVGSWRADTTLNFRGSTINLNGAATIPVASVASMPGFKLADTEFVQGQGWTVKADALSTIVTRAPTHEPYPYHAQGADVKTDLNPLQTTTPDPDSSAATTYDRVNDLPVQNGVTAPDVAKEPLAATSVGQLSQQQVTVLTAQTAADHAAKYPAYDDDGNLMPGFELNEDNDPVYTGPDLGVRGVGVYGQSPEALVSTGFLKSTALDLINNGISVESVLKSAASWTNQLGIGDLSSYLNSKTIQNIAQVGLAIASYVGLQESGVFTGDEDPRYIATFLQPATQYGVDDVVQWVDGFATPTVASNLQIAARQGQYAIDFSNEYTAEIFPGVEPVSIADTTQRNVVDQTMAEVIGDPKVPVPQYTDTEITVTDQAVTQANQQQIAQGLAPDVVVYEDVLQPNGTIIRVPVLLPAGTKDDGTFRFAPGNNQG